MARFQNSLPSAMRGQRNYPMLKCYLLGMSTAWYLQVMSGKNLLRCFYPCTVDELHLTNCWTSGGDQQEEQNWQECKSSRTAKMTRTTTNNGDNHNNKNNHYNITEIIIQLATSYHMPHSQNKWWSPLHRTKRFNDRLSMLQTSMPKRYDVCVSIYIERERDQTFSHYIYSKDRLLAHSS